MAPRSVIGLLVAIMLISVVLSGCLSEVLDPEDEDSLMEPFTRIKGIGTTSSERWSCDIGTNVLNGPCFKTNLRITDGIRCDPPQIFVEILRGDLSGADREARLSELSHSTHPAPTDPFVSCQYEAYWSITANFLYPGSSVEVTARHDQGEETRICEADSSDTCLLQGVMEGTFTIDGPDELKELNFWFEADVSHDFEMLNSPGSYDYETTIKMRT